MKQINSTKSNSLAYLLSGFPRLSETFVLNEILELERLGVELTIFSLKQSTDPDIHKEFNHLKSSVIYLPEKVSIQFLVEAISANFSLLFQTPFKFVCAVFKFLISGKKERYFSLGKSWLRWIWLSRQIQEKNISRLHAHFAHDPTTMAYWVSQLLNRPYSFTAHAKDIYCYSQEWLKRKIHHAQFVVTCTEHNKAYIEQVSHNGTPIHCVHHGVNLLKFSSTSKIQNKKPFIFSIGRLIPKKGFPILLEACAILQRQKIEFECQIAGNGPMLESLQHKVQSLGLQNCVHFPGALTHHILLPLYRKADVFVLPCRLMTDGDRDGVPNVILEAMAMEIPVVSTRVSGIPEAIEHASTGYLVEENNADEVADAIKTILSNRKLAERMGKKARQKILQSFELSKNVGELRELLAA